MGRATRRYVMGALAAVAAATIGMSVAPSAAADPSHCQTSPATTACGLGGASDGGPSAGSSTASTPQSHGSGCSNDYGGYQHC
jgi:hypothetical protein